jgi:hypothetical protein
VVDVGGDHLLSCGLLAVLLPGRVVKVTAAGLVLAARLGWFGFRLLNKMDRRCSPRATLPPGTRGR